MRATSLLSNLKKMVKKIPAPKRDDKPKTKNKMNDFMNIIL